MLFIFRKDSERHVEYLSVNTVETGTIDGNNSDNPSGISQPQANVRVGNLKGTGGLLKARDNRSGRVLVDPRHVCNQKLLLFSPSQQTLTLN